MTTLTKSITKEITWKEIAEAIHAGKAAELLADGDIISIVLKDGVPMRIAVAGIGTYAENEVVFAFRDILPKEHYMNREWTNEGGYEASDMACYLDGEIFDLLPDDLQAVIKERRGHKLWLFSAREVEGEEADRYFDSPEEDVQLPYYKNVENRVKMRNGETDWWWLASPSSANTASFAHVNSNGYSNYNLASISNGIAPGFCV